MDRMPEEKARIVQQAAQRRLEAQSAEKSGETRGPPESYSIAKTRRMPYLAQIEAFYSGDRKTVGRIDDIFVKDITTGLSQFGLGDAPFFMLKRNLEKVTRTQGNNAKYSAHGISRDVIERLPSLLESPTLVISGNGRISVIVDEYVKTQNEDHAPLLIGIDPNSRADGKNAYEIKSMYGRENFRDWLLLRAKDSRILGGDTNKAAALLRDVGINIAEPVAYATDLTQDILTNDDEKVNEKFSADGSTATPQENDKAALAYFGRTHKWSETGYVLLNGARLDFSGRHEGGSGGYRSARLGIQAETRGCEKLQRERKIRLKSEDFSRIWSECRDSNPRPLGPEPMSKPSGRTVSHSLALSGTPAVPLWNSIGLFISATAFGFWDLCGIEFCILKVLPTGFTSNSGCFLPQRAAQKLRRINKEISAGVILPTLSINGKCVVVAKTPSENVQTKKKLAHFL